MDLNLKGRTAFITGASRGIGKAIATAFAAEGVNLGLFGRDVARCNALAEELRNRHAQLRAAVIALDLSDRTAFTLAQILRPNLPFDSVRDFAPISRVGISPGGLIVHPSLPIKKVKDLIALAKARPEQITFSSSGPGGGSH